MKKIYKMIFVLSVVFISQTDSIFSQSNILQGMRHIPQSTNNNPARQPESNVFIGFPALNMYFDIHNTGFVIDDIYAPYAKDSFIYTLDDLENALKDDNYINTEFNTSLINFGFSLPRHFYLTFSISTKINESFSYPKALTEIKDGNYRGEGNSLSFNFKQDFTAYNEIALGLSKRFYNNLTLGMRVKYLSGLVNTSSDNFDIDWYTDADMYAWNFNTNIDVKTSSPVAWEIIYDEEGLPSDVKAEDFDSEEAIKSLFNNNGAAVDLGAEYNLNNKFILSASVIDLGVINWTTNAQNLKQNGTFVYSGVDVGRYITSFDDLVNLDASLGDSVAEDFKDSLINFIKPELNDIGEYRTSLNPKIFVGANLFVNNWLDVGFLYRGTIYDDKLHSAYTLSGNANFLKSWSISASWSMMDNLYNNVGFGFAYRVGLFQWYFMTDNLSPYFWAANESDFSDYLIRNTKRATFQFGVNLLFNKNKIDKGLLE